MLTVQGSKLFKDGQPFFYQADTCWSAFTNATEEEWHYYLDYRQQQGFNVIQIDLLRQWDASTSILDAQPFPMTGDRHQYRYDFDTLNNKYFDLVERMLQAVVDHDMTPALVLLWSNVVPGTWPKQFSKNNHMTIAQVQHYVDFVTRRYRKFNPIYFISGDTDFPSVAIPYYEAVLSTLKQNDPDALTTCHIQGKLETIPDTLLSKIDFFSYQTGHETDNDAFAYQIPLKMRKNGYLGPIIDTEPTYEQIAISGEQMYQTRASARDVRRQAWSAVLSGADAGITYGAHGIWMWQRYGEHFGFGGDDGFDQPADWRDALHFPGANDIHLLAQLLKTQFPDGLQPVSVQLKHTDALRVAKSASQKRYAVYLPSNTEIKLNQIAPSLTHANVQALDLANRVTYNALVKTDGTVAMSPAQADVLLLIDQVES